MPEWLLHVEVFGTPQTVPHGMVSSNPMMTRQLGWAFFLGVRKAPISHDLKRETHENS